MRLPNNESFRGRNNGGPRRERAGNMDLGQSRRFGGARGGRIHSDASHGVRVDHEEIFKELETTRRLLTDPRERAVILPSGAMVSKNKAFASGQKNVNELVLQRTWGGEGIEYRADEQLDDEIIEEDDCINVEISDEAKGRIIREVLASPDNETGGALIGTWDRSADGFINVCIERATGPGDGAVQKPALFEPNMNYYRERADHYREYGWIYIGEWHKHSGQFDELSMTDLNMARELCMKEGWPLLLLPVVNEANGTITLRGHVVMSKQLGGGVVSFKEKISLGSKADLDGKGLIAYIDKELVDDFIGSDELTCEVDGVWNPGESFVFLDLPGAKNASLRLIKAAQTEDVEMDNEEGVLTATVCDDEITCSCVFEGEVTPVRHILLDPANSVYERNAGFAETHELRDKVVTIVGCGSIGSTMALSLARAGVGGFKLFDFDRLEPVNVARHQANLRDLGRNKADAVRDMLHGIDPSIDTAVCTLDIVATKEGFEAFYAAAEESDLVICGTDTDASRKLVNRVAVEAGIRTIQAGVTERAAAGIVHVYVPELDSPCWECYKPPIEESAKRADGVAYSTAKDVRDLTIQPGLAAQIDLVSQVATLRAIDVLMDRFSIERAYTFIKIDKPGSTDGERRLKLSIKHDKELTSPDEACPVCADNEKTDLGADVDDKAEDSADLVSALREIF